MQASLIEHFDSKLNYSLKSYVTIVTDFICQTRYVYHIRYMIYRQGLWSELKAD